MSLPCPQGIPAPVPCDQLPSARPNLFPGGLLGTALGQGQWQPGQLITRLRNGTSSADPQPQAAPPAPAPRSSRTSIDVEALLAAAEASPQDDTSVLGPLLELLQGVGDQLGLAPLDTSLYYYDSDWSYAEEGPAGGEEQGEPVLGPGDFLQAVAVGRAALASRKQAARQVAAGMAQAAAAGVAAGIAAGRG